jgi:hypothetical protein
MPGESDHGRDSVAMGERRAWQWLVRRAGGARADRPPGGSPVHRQLLEEVDRIVDLTHRGGETGRSRRQPAHSGWYLDRLSASSSLVIRVLPAGRAAPAIEDQVSRRWRATVASVAETSTSTGQHVAVRAIARHSGRPGTPTTDQARTELLFGHVTGELSPPLTVRDPATFRDTGSHRRQRQQGSAMSSSRSLSNSDTR